VESSSGSSSEPLNSQSAVTAVLFLNDPPDAGTVSDWFSRKVVGVPFLLLNLLHLQKGGADRVAIYHRHLIGEQRSLLVGIGTDPRLRIPLDWISDPNSLLQALRQNNPCSVFNGSAVWWHTEVAAVLNDNVDAESAHRLRRSPLSDDEMESWVRDADPFKMSQSEPVSIQETIGAPATSVRTVGGDRQTWIQGPADFRAQHERLLKRGGMSNDSPMDRWVTRHFSRQFTRLFINTPVTPNQITWMHLVLGLISGGCFYLGGYTAGAVGAVVLMLSAWLDSTDGEIARLRFQQSPFGGMLDIVADNIVHFAVFLGIGLGLYRTSGNVIYSYLGVLAVVGSLMCFLLMQTTVFNQRTTGSDDAPVAQDESLADQIANRDFIYFLFVMAIIDQLKLFIAITAVGSLIFSGYVGFKKYKAPAPGSPNSI